MKKPVILFLFFLLVLSCTSQRDQISETACPNSYISKEHKHYFSEDNTDSNNDLLYIANINNFKIKCKQKNQDSIHSIFDILFTIKPLSKNVKNYNYSYFVSILDSENNILDKQLFNVEGKFFTDQKNEPLEKVVIESLDQYFPSVDKSYEIVIGFVLTEGKYNFINN
tara:strand:+ start:629 stop:1132 length:504 start_codon:yes stop_codon:yes gene_type:complete